MASIALSATEFRLTMMAATDWSHPQSYRGALGGAAVAVSSKDGSCDTSGTELVRATMVRPTGRSRTKNLSSLSKASRRSSSSSNVCASATGSARRISAIALSR